MKIALQNHPERHTIGLQLKRNRLLADLDDDALAELRELLFVRDGHRGECLLEQGTREPVHFFVLDGVLKRVVTSPAGREMALRFACEGDFETCYEAWRERSAVSYSVHCGARARVAWLPMSHWCAFIARHPRAQHAFRESVVQLGAQIVEHAVGLLLLDAPGRMERFTGAHPDLVERLPQKDLASHLNLSAETLCRLSRRGRGAGRATPRAAAMAFSAAA